MYGPREYAEDDRHKDQQNRTNVTIPVTSRQLGPNGPYGEDELTTARNPHSHRSLSRTRWGAAVLGTLTLLTACSSGGTSEESKPASTPSSSMPKPSVTPSKSVGPEAAGKAAVLQSYDRMWEEQVKAYATADLKGTELKKYAAGAALARAKVDVEGMRKKGIVTKGKPGHKTKVTSTDLKRKVPSAELTDCVDTSTWKFVYRKSGKPVPLPEGAMPRYVTKVKAEKWGKQWMLLELTPTQRAC